MSGDERTVRDLAYRLWEARGRPDGSADHDWLDAERQLKPREPPLLTEEAAPSRSTTATDDALKATFPASDPPASHLPDRPPANAQAKWQAAEAARSEQPKRATARRRTPGTGNA
jgi:hypothetical protein